MPAVAEPESDPPVSGNRSALHILNDVFCLNLALEADGGRFLLIGLLAAELLPNLSPPGPVLVGHVRPKLLKLRHGLF